MRFSPERLLRLAPVLAAIVIPALPSPAAAQLMIAPTRVVLAGTERSTELILVNKGDEQTAFRIDVENRRMRADGALETVTETRPGELFAADMIRFSPRRVILDPGARQSLRVSVTVPAGLAPGEYRSHLRLMSAPTSAGAATPTASDANDGALSIQLIAVRSITIPVIVRVGALDASASVDSAALTNKADNLMVIKLTRAGTRSTYGDLRLTIAGEANPIYNVRGIAIYTPNTDRDVLLPLPADIKAKLVGRDVRIDYVSSDPKAPGLIASRRVQL
ncbi:molecular chaperone [Sphingomonas sp.]|uniref:fimbrial biogenesis chaperone n=1 Tax=Sphingomonas sp. TaxID=28214 RepID=UPI0035A88E95